jgi:aminoglycoside phosphotransferase family enzyme/predicted kinase
VTATRDLTLEQHRLLVAALRRSLGPDCALVETHISTLLLAGEFVYKLRKPLVLPFLDFSNAEQRRHDCEEELRLNRRTAPQLYLDVRPLLGSIDAPRIGEPGGDSGAIDWLLRMRRFDDKLLLDRLATRGALGAADADALARTVADFHAALPASPAAWGDPPSVRAWALANFDALGADAPAALRAWTEREFTRIARRLALRRAQGRVREGHGDLHLGNIVMQGGVPTPFDAIEFNPALRHGDTMADAAFVFMDLWRHGLPQLAWRFASGYAERGGDHDGLALLPFFAVYRAMVRAQVAALRAGQAADGAAAAAAREALADDLHVATELAALPGATPRLVLVGGLSGSGKSHVALALLERLGALRLRSDVERKRLAGMAATDRPAPADLARLYGPSMTLRTYARLQGIARDLLHAGLNVIVDAASLRRHERDAFRALAAQEGAVFSLVECVAPEAVLRERIERRMAAGHDASDATPAVLDFQLGIRERCAAEEGALQLDTDAEPAIVALRCDALVAAWAQ